VNASDHSQSEIDAPVADGAINSSLDDRRGPVIVDVAALAQALTDLSPQQLATLADALDRSRGQSGYPKDDRPWLSVGEAARLAGVRPKTVHNWLSTRRLTRYGVPRRPLVDRRELEDLLRPTVVEIAQRRPQPRSIRGELQRTSACCVSRSG